MNFPDTVNFNFFDLVWLITDTDSQPGQVIGILFKPAGVVYQIQWGINREGWHYDKELTTEKPHKIHL